MAGSGAESKRSARCVADGWAIAGSDVRGGDAAGSDPAGSAVAGSALGRFGTDG